MARRNPMVYAPKSRVTIGEQYSNVGDWAKAASDLFTEMQDKTSGWFSTQTQNRYSQKLKNLYDQKDNWYSRFNGNREATSAIDAIVEDLQNAKDAVEQNGKFYSQWNTKEEYDQWNIYYGGDQATRIQNATANLESKTKAKEDAYNQYNSYLNADTDKLDFMTYDAEAAEKKGQALLDAYKSTEEEEKRAKEILWDAKYDTMTAAQLQELMDSLEDEQEKLHVSELHKNANLAEMKQELVDLNAVTDPESEHYDPDFLNKIAYQSTLLTDGSLGEMDTGYADIDYEFINGNEEISELIVGLDRNYYQISDEERQIYNYWHNYDKEHGTDKAKRYLYLLQETLNARDSAEDYAKIEGKALQEILYGVKSGLARFGNDVNNWYLKPEGYIPMTSTEMTAQKAYEGLADADSLLINGQSLGQHLFNGADAFGYNLPSNIVGGLVGQGGAVADAVASAVVKGMFSGVSDNGAAYRQMINQGYTPQQAEEYSKMVGYHSGIFTAAESVIQDAAGEIWKRTYGGQPGLKGKGTDALGKLLTEKDWLGIKDSLLSQVEAYGYKAVTGQDKPDNETLQAAAKGAVAAKAMDKIFNRMGAAPEQVSLDLRHSILDTLNDPAARDAIAKSGAFTAEQLEKIADGLESVGEKDDGFGTCVKDVVFGENGFAINKYVLQQEVEEGLSGREPDPEFETIKALLERSLPNTYIRR